MLSQSHQARLWVLLSVMLISAQLLWQWQQGGIDAHHLFADPTLPSISNGWGLVLLPLLGTVAAWRLQNTSAPAALWRNLLWSFGYGLVIAALFVSGQETMLIGAILLTFGLALWLPLYRAEYLLGYIAGLSFAFGPVLPLIPAAPAMTIAWLAMLIKAVWRRAADVKKA